jgi:endonuclease YncB( thermonuclease family)
MGSCFSNNTNNTENLKNIPENTEKVPPTPFSTPIKNENENKTILKELTLINDNINNFTYDNYTVENTPLFTFEGIKEHVKILRCLDGDTLDIALRDKITGLVYKHRVRMFGIDTPEMHPKKDKANREEEIKLANISKNALDNLCKENNYIILAHFMKDDKYGRRMAKFFTKDGTCINDWMVTNGYAKNYDGGKKEGF